MILQTILYTHYLSILSEIALAIASLATDIAIVLGVEINDTACSGMTRSFKEQPEVIQS